MTSFELEVGNSRNWCAYDYVELSDGDDSSGRLCGDMGSDYVHVFESPVTVTFQTDVSVTLAGFSMHYEAAHGKYDAKSV